MDILQDAGVLIQLNGKWIGSLLVCVGFLVNMAQSDEEAVWCQREAGVVELLAPLLTLEHYESIKAACIIVSIKLKYTF